MGTACSPSHHYRHDCLKTMRRETITATNAGIVNPTTITTEKDLLNLQKTPLVTSITMSVAASLSS